MSAGLSRTGKYLTVAVNNDARTELRMFDYATMTPVPLPPDANINGVQLSRDEKMLVFGSTTAGRRSTSSITVT